MTRPKIGDEWWSAPTESENGNLIIVTGRENAIAAKEMGYIHRVEVTWKYEPDKTGMPDYATSTLMETITEDLKSAFHKNPVAVMTGIYTGDGERNWIFYSKRPDLFGKVFNTTLAPYDLLPITIYVENDPDWAEYLEMSECRVDSAD